MSDKIRKSETGPSSAADRFMQLLTEIESEGKTGKVLSGDVEGPFFSRAVFGCVIRVGVDEFR